MWVLVAVGREGVWERERSSVKESVFVFDPVGECSSDAECVLVGVGGGVMVRDLVLVGSSLWLSDFVSSCVFVSVGPSPVSVSVPESVGPDFVSSSDGERVVVGLEVRDGVCVAGNTREKDMESDGVFALYVGKLDGDLDKESEKEPPNRGLPWLTLSVRLEVLSGDGVCERGSVCVAVTNGVWEIVR